MLKIHLRNWYRWADHEITLEAPVSFVLGLNGSGKTSLRDAIEFAYLGTGLLRARQLGMSSLPKKELAAVVIRDDFEECEVTVEAAGIRIRRTMDRTGAQEVWRSVNVPGSNADGTGLIGRWSEEEPAPLKRDQGNPFGDTPDDLVRCLLEPRHFYTLDPQRRQEILVMATTSATPDQDVVLETLMRRLEYESKPDLEALEDAAGWVSTGGFRAAEDAAVEQRRDWKRERDAVVVGDEVEPMLSLYGPRDSHGRLLEEGGPEVVLDLALRPAKDHEAHLAELRTAHTQAVRLESSGAGAMGGKLAEAEEALVALQGSESTAVETALAAHIEAGKALGHLEQAPPAEEPLPPARPLADAQLITQTASKTLEAELATEKTAHEAVVALEETEGVSTLISRPDVCPAGPPGMRCAAKPSQWTTCLEKAIGDPSLIAANTDRLRGDLVKAKGAVQAARDAREAALRDEAVVREVWQQHEAAGEGVAQAARDLVAARALVQEREAEVERAVVARAAEVRSAEERVQKAREALEEAKEGDQPAGPSVVDLEASIARGEVVCEASRRYWREVAEREARQIKWDLIQVTVGRWDAICQELKPDGIETELGGNARAAFLALLEPAVALSGEISLDEDCGITVALDRVGHPKHPLQLSESQVLAVGCAIQHALCRLLGFPLLIVDGMDRFDGPHRQAWAKLAVEVAGDYQAAVVGLATITDDPQAPGAPFQTLWLKPDGSTVLLGGEGF